VAGSQQRAITPGRVNDQGEQCGGHRPRLTLDWDGAVRQAARPGSWSLSRVPHPRQAIPGLSSLPANRSAKRYWPGETKDPGSATERKTRDLRWRKQWKSLCEWRMCFWRMCFWAASAQEGETSKGSGRGASYSASRVGARPGWGRSFLQTHETPSAGAGIPPASPLRAPGRRKGEQRKVSGGEGEGECVG
jgi:hypothetical protein